MSMERERGVMLRRLDPEALGELAVGHLRVMAPSNNYTGARFSMAYAEVTHGEDTYVICTEGVGWKVEWSKPLCLGVIPSWLDDDGEPQSSFTDTATVYLSPYEVKRLADASTEVVDLADFVREFGDRLEGNFWHWHRTLTATPKVTR